MEPGGREPAPGELALVQAFVNSTDIEDGREDFDSPAHLREWLVRHDLLPGSIQLGEDDLRRAIDLREALRDLAATNNGDAPGAAALATLNRVAATATLRVRLHQDGRAHLAPAAAGLDGAFARLLGIVHTATIDGTWSRLKVCRKDACRWAFYDASKNRSGAWCTMAICGSRTKARAYRRRQAGSQV